MPNRPFLPIGLPRDATSEDALDQRVGLHLLETLDSLDAVYKSAAFFADVAGHAPLAEYTLTRCLESAHATIGALFLRDGDRLVLHCERADAVRALAVEALTGDLLRKACLLNGEDALPLLRTDAGRRNVLTCPILAGDRTLGLVVLLAPAASPFSSADAKLVAAVTSQASIALSRAQRHREAELERQKLELVVHTHHDGIAVLDAAGRTTLCNPIARELMGGSDVLGGLRAVDPTLTPALLASGSGAREVSVAAGGGHRVVGVECRELHGTDGADGTFLVTLRDLTRQRRDERLNRNFVSLISHKLRTPLTALACALELLEATPPGEQPALLAEMNHRMHDLSELVDRLFDFTDLLEGNAGKHGCVELREVRDDLIAHFAARAAAADAELVWDVPPGGCAVPLPRNRLRVALLNLIDNAIKFAGKEPPWVRIGVRTTPTALLIDVEDRGPGIPSTAQASVLEAFWQHDTDFTGNVPGAGIGIATVREIVRRAGGCLELRDAEPHGCWFTMNLPRPSQGGPG